MCHRTGVRGGMGWGGRPLDYPRSGRASDDARSLSERSACQAGSSLPDEPSLARCARPTPRCPAVSWPAASPSLLGIRTPDPPTRCRSAAPLLLLLPPPAAALWGPATTGSSIAESRCCRRCRCCWGGCCRTRGHLRGMRIPSDQAADRLVLPRRCRCRCRRRWPCCGARLGCCAAAAPLACRAGAARCGVPEGIGSPLGATLPQHRGTVLVPGALSPRCSSRQVLAEEWCRA